MSYRYTATFTSVAHVINPTDQDRSIAQASLAPLRAILPADIDPLKDPDLLYISCDGALGGYVNRNHDGITAKTAVAIHRSAKNKYITVDHDRDQAVGFVLSPTLTKIGSHEVLTDEQALAATEPFNMSFAGVLWKLLKPQLAKYLVKVGDATDSDALSMSWEIGFNEVSIAYKSKNLFEATIVHPGDPSFATYEAMLKVNKGSGKTPAGEDVYRIIGDDAVILGYSIVSSPAAEVKGILPLTFLDNGDSPDATPANDLGEIPESQRSFFQQHPEAGMGYHMCDLTMENGEVLTNVPVMNHRFLPAGIDGAAISSIQISQKSEEKNITSSTARVNPNTAKPMTITSIEQMTESLGKHEAAAATVDFVKAIQSASEKYAADLKAKEDLFKNAEAAKVEREEQNKKLEASLAQVQKELEEVRAKAEETEVAQKFQERMASFDEEFDLDDEDRKIIASDVKALDTDEAFASYMSKAKKLMAAKKKKAKADPKDGDGPDKSKDEKSDDKKNGKKPDNKDDEIDDDGDDNDDGDDEDHKGAKASETEKLVKAALASILADKGQSFPASGVQVDANLLQQMGEAFGQTIKINGKSIVKKVSK